MLKKITNKLGFLKFFREVAAELRATEWIKLRPTLNYTTLIIVSVAFLTILIYILDAIFVALRGLLLSRTIG